MAAGFLLIHAKPSRTWATMLSWSLFAVGIAGYFYIAQARHTENPEDRVTPTFRQMAQGMYDAALKIPERCQEADIPYLVRRLEDVSQSFEDKEDPVRT